MIGRVLTERARRQRSFARLLVARHPLIAATGLGRRIIGTLRHGSPLGYTPLPPYPAVERFAEQPLETGLPGLADADVIVAQEPPAIVEAAQSVPVAATVSTTAQPPATPGSVAPPSSSVDPLVELVRRLQGIPSSQPTVPAPETPQAPQAPRRGPLGHQVEEQRSARSASASVEERAPVSPGGRPPAPPDAAEELPAEHNVEAPASSARTASIGAESLPPLVASAEPPVAAAEAPVSLPERGAPLALAAETAIEPPGPQAALGPPRQDVSLETEAQLHAEVPAQIDAPGAGEPIAERPQVPQQRVSGPAVPLEQDSPQRWAARLFNAPQPQAESILPEPPLEALPQPAMVPEVEAPLVAGVAPPAETPVPRARTSEPVAPAMPDLPAVLTRGEPVSAGSPTVEPGSPLDWAARLFRPQRQEDNVVPHIKPPVPQHRADGLLGQEPEPTSLSEATSRFLRPLVGVDPATVPIYRGPVAQAVAEPLGADAVTAGGAIFMASHDEERAPETLGLLAHELTHVARGREPRYVPPLVRDLPVPSFGEEQLAATVESRVIETARAAPPDQYLQPPPASPSPHGLSSASSDADGTTPSRGNPSTWNGLPAPWEALPDWVTTPASVSGEASAAPPPPAPAPATAPVAAAAPAISLAEMSRSLESSPLQPAQPGAAQEPAAPPPDLDQLARQVYSIVKQRLAMERRRSTN